MAQIQNFLRIGVFLGSESLFLGTLLCEFKYFRFSKPPRLSPPPPRTLAWYIDPNQGLAIYICPCWNNFRLKDDIWILANARTELLCFSVFTVEEHSIKTKLFCCYTIDGWIGCMQNYLSKRRRRWCTLIWLNQTESNPSAVDGGGFFLERGGVTNQKLYNLLNSLRLRNVIFFSFPVSHSLGLCITRADKFCTFNLIKSTQLCLIYMKVNIYLILHLNSTLKTHTFGSTFF